MLSVVIEAFKKSVMFLCTTFNNRFLVYTGTGLYITLHSSSARLLDGISIDLIGIRNSPDLRSVRNKEVKFIWIYPLGSRFSVRCPYQRSSPYYGGFFQENK